MELDANGKTYDVVPRLGAGTEGALWGGYDPTKVLAAFRATKGAFSTINTAELLEDIHAQSGQESQGRPAER